MQEKWSKPTKTLQNVQLRQNFTEYLALSFKTFLTWDITINSKLLDCSLQRDEGDGKRQLGKTGLSQQLSSKHIFNYHAYLYD